MPSRLTQSQIGKLERLQDQFLRETLNELSMLTRIAINGTALGTEEIGGAELLTALPQIACFATIRLQDASPGLLFVTAPVASSMIDAVLGSESPLFTERTGTFTALETTLLQAPLEKVMSSLTSAWCEEMSPIKAGIGNVISDPRLLRLDAHGTLLLMRFGLEIGPREGELCVALPFRLTKPPEEAAATSEANEDQQNNMLTLLRDAQMEFIVQAAGSSVSVGDLSALRPGDVFTFGRSVDDPLTGLLNNRPLYRGHIMVQGTRRCFVIESANESNRS